MTGEIECATIIFVPEDITTAILLRLPLGSCIGRFRCVSRWWRNLLSDPDFIWKFLSYHDHTAAQQQQLLISGRRVTNNNGIIISFSSVHSYDALLRRPCPDGRSVGFGDLAIARGKRTEVLCHFDGIFCISTAASTASPSAMFLWNPTTSETKILPPLPRSRTWASMEIAGFGFDHRTQDYKVVRYDAQYYYWAWVYSLKEDCWKEMNLSRDLFSCLTKCYSGYNYVNRVDHHHTSRNEKCYWFASTSGGKCEILSFDMAAEVFEIVAVPNPTATLRSRKRRPYKRLSYSSAMAGGYRMVKDCLVVTFQRPRGGSYEVWGMLKCGVGESWTRFYCFTPPPVCRTSHIGICNDEGVYVFEDNVGRAIAVDVTKGGGIVCDALFDAKGARGLRFHTFVSNSTLFRSMST